MKYTKQLFVYATLALIVCCLLFGCCRFSEGLANPPKYDPSSTPTELQCLDDDGLWDGEKCGPNPVDAKRNVPVPEGFANYF